MLDMLDLSLRDLEYVVAVEAERNFSRAAERLHMAQPALSQAIMRIERRLGVELFERNSRHVVPTAAGTLLCVDALDILARVERAVHRTRQVGGLAAAVHVHVSEPSLETPRRLLSAVRASSNPTSQSTRPRCPTPRWSTSCAAAASASPSGGGCPATRSVRSWCAARPSAC